MNQLPPHQTIFNCFKHIFQSGECGINNYVSLTQNLSKEERQIYGEFNCMLDKLTSYIKAFKIIKMQSEAMKEKKCEKKLVEEMVPLLSQLYESQDMANFAKHNFIKANQKIQFRRQTKIQQKFNDQLEKLKFQKFEQILTIEQKIQKLVLRVNIYEAFIYSFNQESYYPQKLSIYQKQRLNFYQQNARYLNPQIINRINFGEQLKIKMFKLSGMILHEFQDQKKQFQNLSTQERFRKYIKNNNQDLANINKILVYLKNVCKQLNWREDIIGINEIKNRQLTQNLIQLKECFQKLAQNYLALKNKTNNNFSTPQSVEMKQQKQGNLLNKQYRSFFQNIFQYNYPQQHGRDIKYKKEKIRNLINDGVAKEHYQKLIINMFKQSNRALNRQQLKQQYILQNFEALKDKLIKQFTLFEEQIQHLKGQKKVFGDDLADRSQYQINIETYLINISQNFFPQNILQFHLNDSTAQKFMKIQQLLEKIIEKINQTNSLQSENTEQKAKLEKTETVKKDQQSYKIQFESKQKQNQQLSTTLQKYNTEINKLNKKMEEQKLTISEMESQKIQNQSKIVKYENQINQNNQKIKQLQNQIFNEKNHKQTLQKQMNELKINQIHIFQTIPHQNKNQQIENIPQNKITKEQKEQVTNTKLSQSQIQKLNKRILQLQHLNVESKLQFQEEIDKLKQQIQINQLDKQQIANRLQLKHLDAIDQLNKKVRAEEQKQRQKIAQLQCKIKQQNEKEQNLNLKMINQLTKSIKFNQSVNISVISIKNDPNQSHIEDNQYFQNQEYQNQIQKNDISIIELKNQLQNTVIINLEKQRTNYLIQNQKLNKEKKEINQELNQLKQILREKNNQINDYNQKINGFANQLKNSKKTIQKIMKYNDQYKQQLRIRINKQGIKEHTEWTSPFPQYIHYNRILFHGQIFQQNELYKQLLINHINLFMKKNIQKTVLLYKFDEKNSTNVHQYIDNKRGLVCVVKTPSAIVAGFYSGALNNKQIMTEKALIISVTNNQSYHLNDKKRAMTYDQFFVIFGNAQMRLRAGQNIIFSNFGVSNSSYNYRGKKIGDFLNNGDKKEVTFDTVEYYQIFFDE